MVRDSPDIYINETTPGYTVAQHYPAGDKFGTIFDHSSEDTASRPSFVCAEQHANDLRSRHSKIIIDGVIYTVFGDVFRDGMGLATVTLQED